MRMMIIAVVALLVLGGGGAGAYYYFQQPAEASSGEEHTDAATGKDKSDKKHAKAGEHETTQFVELDPLILPILGNDGVNQTVSLVIALEVADEKAAAIVEHMSPKLKDAYIQDMYGMLNQHAALKGGVLQVSELKSRLNKISTDVLGEDVVHDVLLQVVQQRPI